MLTSITTITVISKSFSDGSTETTDEFLKKYHPVIKDLNKGKYSLREIAKLNSVSLATVQKVKKNIAVIN